MTTIATTTSRVADAATKARAAAQATMRRVLSFAHLALLGSAAKGSGKGSSKPSPAPAPAARTTAPAKTVKAARQPSRPARAAAAASSEGDPSAELRGDSPASLARQRERARCEAIVMSPAGLANLSMAKHLAFDTTVTRDEALQLLAMAPQPKARGMSAAASAARASRNPSLGCGGSLPVCSSQARAATWDRSLQAAAGGP
jgi:hypothetical protein